MVNFVIIEFLVFVFMVFASFVIAHLGLMIVEHLDRYFSTERRRPDRVSPEVAARRHAA